MKPLRGKCNAYSEGGWNNSMVILALDEKESSKHEVTVKMQPGDENKKFTILAMGYCD